MQITTRTPRTLAEVLSQAIQIEGHDPIQQLIKAGSAEIPAVSGVSSFSRLYLNHSGTLFIHIFNSLCLFHHLHFLSVTEAFVPPISLNFNGVNFTHTRTHTIKTSKLTVAHFSGGDISKIEIVSCPECSRCPFCVRSSSCRSRVALRCCLGWTLLTVVGLIAEVSQM